MRDAITYVRDEILDNKIGGEEPEWLPISLKGKAALRRVLAVAEAAVAYADECAPYHDNAVLQGSVGEVEQALISAVSALTEGA